MNPMIIKVGLAGVAGFLGWKLYKQKKMSPTSEDYQAVTVTGPAGVPVTVATPVAEDVSVEQATQQVMSRPPSIDRPPMDWSSPEEPPPMAGGPVQTVPTTILGQGTVYAPQGSVSVTPSGDVTQVAPIVVSPGGSASMAVGNTLDVQRGLNTLGCNPKLVEDGKLGPKTTAAIKAFQSKNHLPTDGIAGPVTKAAISAALLLLAGGGSLAGATAQFSNPASGVATTPGGATVNTTPALKWSVKDVQHALNILGATPKLTEDGASGPKTVAAVKSYQAANALTPDGIAGPKTKTALYLAISQVHP